MASVDEVVRGRDTSQPSAAFRGTYRGVVTRSTGSQVSFVVPSIDDGVQDFELADYPRAAAYQPAAVPSSAAGKPPVGTKLAVAFDDGDLDSPMVLAVYGWPS